MVHGKESRTSPEISTSSVYAQAADRARGSRAMNLWKSDPPSDNEKDASDPEEPVRAHAATTTTSRPSVAHKSPINNVEHAPAQKRAAPEKPGRSHPPQKRPKQALVPDRTGWSQQMRDQVIIYLAKNPDSPIEDFVDSEIIRAAKRLQPVVSLIPIDIEPFDAATIMSSMMKTCARDFSEWARTSFAEDDRPTGNDDLWKNIEAAVVRMTPIVFRAVMKWSVDAPPSWTNDIPSLSEESAKMLFIGFTDALRGFENTP